MRGGAENTEYAPLTDVERGSSASPGTAVENAPRADRGDTPRVAVAITRTNHDIYRAFVLGKFIEEGYVHLPPPPMAPSPFDRTYRCISTLLLLPNFLLLLLIGLAHSGWWTVPTSAGEVAVGDTANFRVVARFAATMNVSLIFATLSARLIHCELAMTGMSGMSATERLLRFTDAGLSWDARLVSFTMACGMIYTALFSPSFDRLSIIIAQICYGGMGAFMLLLAAAKYIQTPVLIAGPHVRNKTSLRAQCARQARDVMCIYLALLVVLLRFAAYFNFVAEIIPIVDEEQGCDTDSRNASSGCRGFEGRSQCELNLGFLPAAMIVFMAGTYDKLLAYGSSLTDVLSKMQAGGLPIGAFVGAAIPALIFLMNVIAVSIGLDDAEVCNIMGYVSWAPYVVVMLPTAILVPLQVATFILEQHCPSRTLRGCNGMHRVIMGTKERDMVGMAAGMGVRESRWDTQGEWSAFLVSRLPATLPCA